MFFLMGGGSPQAIGPSSRAQICSEVSRSSSTNGRACAWARNTPSSFTKGVMWAGAQRPLARGATNQCRRRNFGVELQGLDFRVGRAILALTQRGRSSIAAKTLSQFFSFPPPLLHACQCKPFFSERRFKRLRDVHSRAQPVLRVKLQPLVRVLRRGLRCGYHEETLVLHRRYFAGWRCGEHPGVVGPHGAHGTPPPPPCAAGPLRRLAAAPLPCRARAVGVRRQGEPGVPLPPQTRTTAHISLLQDCF